MWSTQLPRVVTGGVIRSQCWTSVNWTARLRCRPFPDSRLCVHGRSPVGCRRYSELRYARLHPAHLPGPGRDRPDRSRSDAAAPVFPGPNVRSAGRRLRDADGMRTPQKPAGGSHRGIAKSHTESEGRGRRPELRIGERLPRACQPVDAGRSRGSSTAGPRADSTGEPPGGDRRVAACRREGSGGRAQPRAIGANAVRGRAFGRCGSGAARSARAGPYPQGGAAAAGETRRADLEAGTRDGNVSSRARLRRRARRSKTATGAAANDGGTYRTSCALVAVDLRMPAQHAGAAGRGPLVAGNDLRPRTALAGCRPRVDGSLRDSEGAFAGGLVPRGVRSIPRGRPWGRVAGLVELP